MTTPNYGDAALARFGLANLVMNLRPQGWTIRDHTAFTNTIIHIVKNKYPPPYTQLDFESCAVIFHIETRDFEVRMGSREALLKDNK